MINPDTYIFDFGRYIDKPYSKAPVSYILWAHFEHPVFELPPEELERVSAISKAGSRKNRMRRNYAAGHGWVE